MPTTETKRRRGTATQCNTFTGAEAEVIVDTTNDRLRIHDGIKAGGYHVPNHVDVQQQTFNYGTVGGTANAITLTSSTNAPITAYALPLKLTFKATATNTTATTVNVDGVGVKNIHQVLGGAVVALTGGEIVNGGIYDITYDGVQFQLTNGAGVVVPTSASTAEVAAQTAVDEFIRPDTLKYSPVVPKAVAEINNAGSGGTLIYGINISSISDITGGSQINFTTAMAGTSYFALVEYRDQITGAYGTPTVTKATGNIQIGGSSGTRKIRVIIFEG